MRTRFEAQSSGKRCLKDINKNPEKFLSYIPGRLARQIVEIGASSRSHKTTLG